MCDEVLPIVAFLKCCQEYKVESVTYVGNGAQNYDGIFNTTTGERYHLEVTCAKDGKLEFYRMLHMDKYRKVPMSASIKDIDEAISNGMSARMEFVDASVQRMNSMSSILQRLRKKLSKPYPEKAILLIVENENIFRDSGERSSFVSELGIFNEQGKFSAIYLINSWEPSCSKIA